MQGICKFVEIVKEPMEKGAKVKMMVNLIIFVNMMFVQMEKSVHLCCLLVIQYC